MSRDVLRAGIGAAAAAALAVVVVHVVNEVAFDARFYHLNANAEGNALTWLSAAAAAGGSVVALLLCAATRDRVVLLLAALLAFFSLDDAMQVHERGGEALGAARLWLVLYLPVVAAAAWAILRLARAAPGDVARTLRLGLVLAASGLAIEVVGPVTKELRDRGIAWPNALRVGVEEGVELAAWIVLATALAALLGAALAQSPSARAGDAEETVNGTGSPAAASPSASRATAQSQ